MGWFSTTIRALLMASALLAIGSPALAASKWLRAESRHFVVYSDDDERMLRGYVAMLEDFDALLRVFHNLDPYTPTGHKLDVYVVKDRKEMLRVDPTTKPGFVGVYIPAEGGIFAVAVRGSSSQLDRTIGDDTVLHEYAHHFMLQYFANAYPSWYVEGFAEYFATADLGERITVGRVNTMRAVGLTRAPWLPARELLTRSPAQLAAGRVVESFYGESWLLTHYLMDDPERRTLFVQYLRGFSTGSRDPVGLWRRTFNQDPEELDQALQAYRYAPLLGSSWARMWAKPTVTITAVPSGQASVILESQQLKTGKRPGGEGLLPTLRKEARRHAKERFVQVALARAEILYGDRAKGEAILQSLVTANPKDSEALRVLAMSKIEGAGEGENKAEAYRQAGRLLTAALQADPDDYQALYRYAQTRTVEPGYPTENTLNVLLKAVSLAPQVSHMRIVAADAAMRHDEFDTARRMLDPVAGSPHNPSEAAQAQQLLNTLNSMVGLTPAPPAPVSPVRLAPSSMNGPAPPPPRLVPPVKKEERIEQTAPPRPPEAAASPARPGS